MPMTEMRIGDQTIRYDRDANLAGLPMPAGLDGKSLTPLIKNPKAKWEKPAYTYQVRGEVRGVTVRTGRFRYTEWDGGPKGTELYDEANDPAEMRNLAADPKYAASVKEMKGLLAGHLW